MDDFPTPLDLIITAWINCQCSLYTLGVFDITDPEERQGEAFFYLREDASKKLLLPIFTSESMALRFIEAHPVPHAKVVLMSRKKFEILQKKHKVCGIVAEASYEPYHFQPIFID